jgi:hypothetical protein
MRLELVGRFELIWCGRLGAGQLQDVALGMAALVGVSGQRVVRAGAVDQVESRQADTGVVVGLQVHGRYEAALAVVSVKRRKKKLETDMSLDFISEITMLSKPWYNMLS